MKKVDIPCPPDAWPKAFKGKVAIGIIRVRGNRSMWLVFDVEDRNATTVYGAIGEGKSMPAEVKAQEPVIYSSGDREIWVLITNSKKEFYEKVAKAKLHIGGDFREFGRLTGRLIRLSEQAGLWLRLDEIFDELAS